jgi:preprotein translocase subunit SecF
MQILTDTKIDFMKLRGVLGAISAVLVIGSLVYVFFLGNLNIGIDFAGGTQVAVKFSAEPDLDELRQTLNDAGFPEARIQRYGAPGTHEVLIRTAAEPGTDAGSSSDSLLKALDARFDADSAGAKTNLNRVGSSALVDLLTARDPDSFGVVEGAEAEATEGYETAAKAILDLRKREGLVSSWDELGALPEVSEATAAALKEETFLGTFSILSVENVGPQIGGELKRKGILAVLLSLAGMLIYIALRFELRFGVGAVVAIFHDVAVTLGLYTFFGYEFNLTTIAAFLTLVGYSVNDTVVVFDRVRENMQRSRREDLGTILNTSLNQTLSRTVMTSGTTLLVVLTLFLYGGDVLRGFSFVLLIGIVVGTYSSVFVASPVVLWWERFLGAEARSRRSRAK